MTDVMRWLSSNVIAALSIFGAAVAFTVSTWQQASQRRAERDERQFQAFHKVVEGVVSPDPKGGPITLTGRPRSSSSCVTSPAITTLPNAC
jgi:hypothetical protein